VNYDDETLMAYADGELDAALTAEISAAMETDPVLAQRVERHRALRTQVAGAYATVLEQPVPERLLAAANGPAAPRLAGDSPRGEVAQFPGRAPLTEGRPWGGREWLALAASLVETCNDRFIKRCQALYPLHRYERLAPLMHELRAIKDPVEIGIMRKACDITGAGFRRLLGFVKPGIGEWEIEAELLHEFVRRGSRGFAYGPIVASGANACVLHYTENHARCRDGDLVLLDVAAEYAGWASDLTRTLPVNGRSRFTDCTSIRRGGAFASTARMSISPRRNSACCSCSPRIPASSSAAKRC